VFAATILCEGQMTLRATRVGTETMAGQIARLVDSAPVGDTRMQNHAERFADRLVLPTLGHRRTDTRRESLPVLGDCRLWHWHPRRRSDRGAVIHDQRRPQYIRINGTLVGGLVGLTIFMVTRAFG